MSDLSSTAEFSKGMQQPGLGQPEARTLEPLLDLPWGDRDPSTLTQDIGIASSDFTAV